MRRDSRSSPVRTYFFPFLLFAFALVAGAFVNAAFFAFMRSEIPCWVARCRVAPGVRPSAFAIFASNSFPAIFRSVAKSCLDHARLTDFVCFSDFFVILDIFLLGLQFKSGTSPGLSYLLRNTVLSTNRAILLPPKLASAKTGTSSTTQLKHLAPCDGFNR